MQEVHVRPVDLGGELVQTVQLALSPPPVVAGAPVFGQLLEIVQRDAAAPTGARDLGRPAGFAEPAVKIVDVLLRNGDTEGTHGMAPLTCEATTSAECEVLEVALWRGGVVLGPAWGGRSNRGGI